MVPIEDYAVVGAGRSMALISRGGSLDWLCWPRPDSDPFFAALLQPGGGSFRLAPEGYESVVRRYVEDTNVLETVYTTATGRALVTDFMPAYAADDGAGEPRAEHEVIRIVRGLAGRVRVGVDYEPRRRMGLAALELEDRAAFGVATECDGGLLRLAADRRLRVERHRATAAFTLEAGERAVFSLTFSLEAPGVVRHLGAGVEADLEATEGLWRAWVSRMNYRGDFGAAVRRSALALKLCVYAPSGAVVAAPTTSLPEAPGGELNWDYRYCWLRDAAFTARALMGLGFHDEAGAFVFWLLHATRLTRPELRVFYDVYGRAPGPETNLFQLGGYEGARPVRIGNAARRQLQLDVYGEVVDAAARHVFFRGALDRETERLLVKLAEFVCAHWREPDHGIWELRGGAKAYTHSRLLCWVVLDRLCMLADRGLLKHYRPSPGIRAVRDEIGEAVRARGWSDEAGAYTQAFGNTQLDAAVLLLAWYGLEDPAGERMQKTFARLDAALGRDGCLWRFERSVQEENTFVACSFWAAEYLALAGRIDEAERRFEALLAKANDVGLYAEELRPSDGRFWGNFPQAFSHVGLINAALSIEEARGKARHRGKTTGPGGPEAHAPR